MAENNEELQWITVNGKHIPIKPGESKKEAISKAFSEDRDGWDGENADKETYDAYMKEAAEETARVNTGQQKEVKGQGVEIESKEEEMKTDKNGVKYLEFGSEKEAKDYFNNNDLPDETVMYGNKIYFGKQDKKEKPDATTYEGAEVIGGDDDNEGMLKDKTPLSKEESDNIKSAEDKYNAYKEKGKSTWNQKLSKGDKVIFKDKNGNDTVGYINGFWKNEKLQDEDAYEEGKDNLWHDFRGLGLIDENGKEIGNINANQILKHEKIGNNLGTPEDFSKKTAKMPNGKEMSLFDFAHNIVNYLDTETAAYIIASKFGVSENDAKAYLQSPYNTEGSKEDYERKLTKSKSSGKPKHHWEQPNDKEQQPHLVIEEGPNKGTYDSWDDYYSSVKGK